MIFMTYSMPSFTRLLQGVNGVNYRTISRNGTLSTAITMCGEINQTRQLIRYYLELVQHVMVDGGYTGNDFADQVKLILNAKTTVAKRNELHMFTVLPQRWIVERSWSWLDKCRRLWKNCERALNSSLQMVVLAFLKIVLKRY